jgi:hypothetical protein
MSARNERCAGALRNSAARLGVPAQWAHGALGTAVLLSGYYFPIFRLDALIVAPGE